MANNTQMMRVSKEFAEYIKQMSIQTGLTRSALSHIFAMNMRNNQMQIEVPRNFKRKKKVIVRKQDDYELFAWPPRI